VFTGIVRELGVLEAIEGDGDGARLRIRAPRAAADAEVGDSIAVNGVCLTVVQIGKATLAFDAVPETLTRSSLGELEPGADVNIEPALRAGEPLGGHIVQGHVDGVGTVRALEREGEGVRLEVEVPAGLARYCVDKGSIALEGVSLTIAKVEDDTVTIALVPHTLAATTLGRLEPADVVNVEVDVLAKHVERLLAGRLEP
jgi:riboflavin synthase